jgi:hypothetical protein
LEIGTVREQEDEGKRGKKKEVSKYWYVEELVHQLPSSYIDKPEEV